MVKPHSLLSVAIGGPNSSLVPSPTSSSSLCWGLHFVIISSNNMTEIPLPWFYCQLQKEDSDKPYEETQLPICSHTLLTGKSKYQLKIVVNIFWTNSMVFLSFPGYSNNCINKLMPNNNEEKGNSSRATSRSWKRKSQEKDKFPRFSQTFENEKRNLQRKIKEKNAQFLGFSHGFFIF